MRCATGRNLNDDSIVGRSEALDKAMLIRRECVQNFFYREISSTVVVLLDFRSVPVAGAEALFWAVMDKNELNRTELMISK